jgi:serine phosphatase RsbU (regulator of sigma subunit)
MQKELEIARNIQMGILPQVLRLPNLEIAARMMPAEEVGGDYYDILPTDDGGWICIGDVAGHGLPAGLIMVMMRSIVASLIEQNPNADPRDVLRVLNATMYQSVRDRLGQTEHATLSIMRYRKDGTLLISGRHEDIVVAGSGKKRSHLLETPGMWVGIVPDVTEMNENMVHRLSAGDVFVLYSDGVIEARNASGHLFGMERLQNIVDTHRDASVNDILERIFEAVDAWAVKQFDDVTLLVLRYRPDTSPTSLPAPS